MLNRFLENTEHVALLGIKTKNVRQLVFYTQWITTNVYVFEGALAILRYSDFKRYGQNKAVPYQLYREGAELIDFYPNYQRRLIYNIWVEDDELVIEYQYPALVEVRAQLRLQGVVESEQFEDIRRLLAF